MRHEQKRIIRDRLLKLGSKMKVIPLHPTPEDRAAGWTDDPTPETDAEFIAAHERMHEIVASKPPTNNQLMNEVVDYVINETLAEYGSRWDEDGVEHPVTREEWEAARAKDIADGWVTPAGEFKPKENDDETG